MREWVSECVCVRVWKLLGEEVWGTTPYEHCLFREWSYCRTIMLTECKKSENVLLYEILLLKYKDAVNNSTCSSLFRSVFRFPHLSWLNSGFYIMSILSSVLHVYIIHMLLLWLFKTKQDFFHHKLLWDKILKYPTITKTTQCRKCQCHPCTRKEKTSETVITVIDTTNIMCFCRTV